MKTVLKAFIIIFILPDALWGGLLRDNYKSIVPKSRPLYQIEIDFDYEKRSYKGKERIIFDYPFAKNMGIILRLFANSCAAPEKSLQIKSIKINGLNSDFIYKNGCTVEIKGDFKEKRRYLIDIEFNALLPEIPEEESDILISSIKELLGIRTQKIEENNYGIFGCSSSVCNMASPIPSLAKISKDGWSVLNNSGLGDYQRGDFADYHIIVLTDISTIVVSNGVNKGLQKLSEGKVKYVFEAESVNEIVIEVSDSFECERREIDGILYSSYYTSKSHRALALSTIDIASQAIDFFSRLYSKYPYTEFKIVTAPMTGGAGGVEFPALITVGDFFYSELYEMPSEGRFIAEDIMSQMFEFVVAHEVAHQWFSTLIPSDARKEPYLDEGFASFSAYLYFKNRYGDKEAKRVLENQIRLNYVVMRLMGYRDLPIITPIEDYKNMFQYAGIIYGKAPLFFVRLRELIGEAVFDALISRWVTERSFKDSSIRHLMTFLKNNEHQKASQIDYFYSRWFENTYGDVDIGKGTLGDILKLLNKGEDIDFDLSIENFKDWLENTFEMFRQYK